MITVFGNSIGDRYNSVINSMYYNRQISKKYVINYSVTKHVAVNNSCWENHYI